MFAAVLPGDAGNGDRNGQGGANLPGSRRAPPIAKQLAMRCRGKPPPKRRSRSGGEVPFTPLRSATRKASGYTGAMQKGHPASPTPPKRRSIA
eukprot:CAMPEP_0176069720 /NCGR_PEP_ID=MMETSP0120_2-20121206/34813_1 /TAXON_ID=160619 /ORGANISM="Kryptoperidinium foliaceum, Strain CCMP 1326" /LENGTH=92 /DNA_ID=CAMNT_0017403359 /DNA_START=21 /DNA_END=295 /DNA_ORIENTATION=+